MPGAARPQKWRQFKSIRHSFDQITSQITHCEFIALAANHSQLAAKELGLHATHSAKRKKSNARRSHKLLPLFCPSINIMLIIHYYVFARLTPGLVWSQAGNAFGGIVRFGRDAGAANERAAELLTQ